MSKLLNHTSSKTFRYSLLGFVAAAVCFAAYAGAATPNRPRVPANLKATIEQAAAAGISSGGVQGTKGSEAPTGWVGYTKCSAVQSWHPDYALAYFPDGSYAYTSSHSVGQALVQGCASDQFIWIYWTSGTTWTDVYFDN